MSSRLLSLTESLDSPVRRIICDRVVDRHEGLEEPSRRLVALRRRYLQEQCRASNLNTMDPKQKGGWSVPRGGATGAGGWMAWERRTWKKSTETMTTEDIGTYESASNGPEGTRQQQQPNGTPRGAGQSVRAGDAAQRRRMLHHAPPQPLLRRPQRLGRRCCTRLPLVGQCGPRGPKVSWAV